MISNLRLFFLFFILNLFDKSIYLEYLKNLSTVKDKENFQKNSGQNQWTILPEFPGFDVIKGVNYEFMHAFLFGIVGYLSGALFGPAKSTPSTYESNDKTNLPTIALKNINL